MNTLIVGAGPAGLAVAGCLRQRQQPFQIIEGSHQTGNSWHRHYDRLHLHTHRSLSALPGLKFPRGTPAYPSRLAVVNYLQAYAERFGIRPVVGCAMTGLKQIEGGWQVETSTGLRQAAHVVICIGYNRVPLIPDFAPRGDPTFMHSAAYRNPDSVPGPRNLVVGMGNSGAEIALDLAEASRQVDVAVRGPLNVVPRDVLGIPMNRLAQWTRLLPARWLEKLSARSRARLYGDLPDLGLAPLPYGAQCQIDQHQRVPLIDIGTVDAIRRGDIGVRPGVIQAQQGQVTFADNSQQRYDGIVLATGYRPQLQELLPNQTSLFNAAGAPTHSGIQCAPRLWFCGYKVSIKGMLRQIGIEARAIAEGIAHPVAGDNPGQREPTA